MLAVIEKILESTYLVHFFSPYFRFHEQGVYDLPAFIDHILETAGRRNLLYVGYSLSSGMLIAMNSERPEYNDKILGAALLAPAGHLMKWEENPFEYLAGIRVVDSMLVSACNQSRVISSWTWLINLYSFMSTL